jgi:hypothetical protein
MDLIDSSPAMKVSSVDFPLGLKVVMVSISVAFHQRALAESFLLRTFPEFDPAD